MDLEHAEEVREYIIDRLVKDNKTIERYARILQRRPDLIETKRKIANSEIEAQYAREAFSAIEDIFFEENWNIIKAIATIYLVRISKEKTKVA